MGRHRSISTVSCLEKPPCAGNYCLTIIGFTLITINVNPSQCWPLWDKCDSTEHERRQLLIARLPKISILNGGDVIGSVEREDAERSFIRYYLDKPESDRPERYFVMSFFK